MEFGSWAALYAAVGASHPRASMVVVIGLFGLLGMAVGSGCWYLIGREYQRECEREERRQAEQSQALVKFSELESRFQHFQQQVEERDRKAEERGRKAEEPENEREQKATEEQTRRRASRDHLAQFINVGKQLADLCRENAITEDEAEEKALAWYQVAHMLLQSVEPSFASRFLSAAGPTYTNTATGKRANVWNFLNVKLEALRRILSEFRY